MLTSQGELDEALAAVRPSRSADEVWAEVRAAAGGRRPMPTRPSLRETGDRRADRTRRWRWAVPLAAAAGLAGLIWLRAGDGDVPDTGAGARAPVTAPSVSGPTEAGQLVVAAPSARNVLVFETADPSITVIWLD